MQLIQKCPLFNSQYKTDVNWTFASVISRNSSQVKKIRIVCLTLYMQTYKYANHAFLYSQHNGPNVNFRRAPVSRLLKPRLHDTTCCQTGCQTSLTTGLTTGCIVYTARCQTGCTTRFDNRLNEQPLFVQPNVGRTATVRSTDCQTGLYNRFDNRLYRVNGVLRKTHCWWLITRMWADAQRDGRPAEWRLLRKIRNSIPCTTPQSLADARCWSAVQ